MSPRRAGHYRGRRAASIASEIGSQYSLPATDDEKLRRLVEQHLGTSAAGDGGYAYGRRTGELSELDRVKHDGPGIAELRRELERVTARDKNSDAAFRAHLAQYPDRSVRERLIFEAEQLAESDYRNRVPWLVVRAVLLETSSPTEAVNMLLRSPIGPQARERALQCFGRLMEF
jgi:hypothetical protein